MATFYMDFLLPQYTESFAYCWTGHSCHACIHSIILAHCHVLDQPKHTVVTNILLSDGVVEQLSRTKIFLKGGRSRLKRLNRFTGSLPRG